MRERNRLHHSRTLAVALAAGLALSGLTGPAVAASLEADFNKDGYDDLAIGVPGEERRGAVNIIYGSRAGLTAQDSQLWTQDVPGVEGDTDSFEDFGAALATGDFNGDGFADLAIGVPGDDVGTFSWAGAVNVLYGSAAGLTVAGNQRWHKDLPGILGTAGDFDFFASTLAAGDFDGDGKDDLAIGAPREDVGRHMAAGRVYVLYGTRRGLSAKGNQMWHQNVKRIPGRARSLDGFGTGLAAGDFNGDRRDDLAIGAPLDAVKSSGVSLLAGAVHVLYGSRRGLTANGTQHWHQNVRGVPGTADWGEQFGFALETGDFDEDGRDDLAVGVPLDVVGKAGNAAGSVNVIFGSSRGLNASGSEIWHQNSKGIAESAELQDVFGLSLAAGDFDGNGADDLAIGVPRESVRSVTNAGSVNILHGGRSGLSASGDQLWHQNSKGISDVAEEGDAFGQAVFAGDFNGDGRYDLAVGVPGEDSGAIQDTGAVHVFHGTGRGLRAAGDQIWHQDDPGIEDLAEERDTFGLAMP